MKDEYEKSDAVNGPRARSGADGANRDSGSPEPRGPTRAPWSNAQHVCEAWTGVPGTVSCPACADYRDWVEESISRAVGRLRPTNGGRAVTGVREYPYEGRARRFRWYELADDDIFVCRCGWRGTFSDCATEMFRDLVEATCQRCDTMLAIRAHPTTSQTRQAVAAGDTRAASELGHVDDIEARWRKAAALELRPDSKLPDYANRVIDFLWDFDEVDGEQWTVLRVGDDVIWRELAYWEGQDRFIAVRKILRDRYGAGFRSLTFTPAAALYLFGDEGSRI